MSMVLPHQIAQANHDAFTAFDTFANNDYPGRGIIMGQTPGGLLVQLYFLSGRSDESQNRRLEADPSRPVNIKTVLADPTKGDPKDALRIYVAMSECAGNFIVSNGAQTTAVLSIADLLSGLPAWTYEPDKPNNTNRITGAWAPTPGKKGSYDLHFLTLRKSLLPPTTGDDPPCEQITWSIHDHRSWQPGFGFGISTYEGNGNPLPAFRGDPLLLPIESESPEEIGTKYWSALCSSAPERRVALMVKLIDPATRKSTLWIKNKHPELVAAE